MKVQIYFFNLEISVTVSALMQCELHLLDTIEKSMRSRETISTVKVPIQMLLLDPHRTSQVGPRPLSSNHEADVTQLVQAEGDLQRKLYMKQAWAAMIHSARVSQKMAMLFLGC